jgi:hypothetical protein
MKRQKQNVRSMVYQYGTVPARIAPVEGEEAALAQMRLARRLWNVLVTIYRTHTAGYRRVMHDEVQEEIDQLKKRKTALGEERKALLKKARSRVPTPEIDAELKRAGAAFHMLVERQKATKAERHKVRRPALDALEQRRYRRIKRAGQAAVSLGLYWGTCNAIVQSADTASKLGELQYHGFRGTGTVTAQIIGGASTGECVSGNHTFFQVEAPTPGQKWRYARVRIGSTGRAPRWLAVPVVYHRDIPREARIKSVSATRRLLAGKVRWSLNVTVTLPPVIPKGEGGTVAFDIGYRLLPEGIRVAYWQDDAGQHGEVLVSNSDRNQFEEVSRQRSPGRHGTRPVPAEVGGFSGILRAGRGMEKPHPVPCTVAFLGPPGRCGALVERPPSGGR